MKTKDKQLPDVSLSPDRMTALLRELADLIERDIVSVSEVTLVDQVRPNEFLSQTLMGAISPRSLSKT